MHHTVRQVLHQTLLVSVLSICLFGCSRTPQAYLQPNDPIVYKHTIIRPAKTDSAIDQPTTDLTASSSAVAPASLVPDWKNDGTSAGQNVPVRLSQSAGRRTGQQTRSRASAVAECDQIVLRNGDVIEAKVKEVGVNEIRYKKCDRQDGPDYTISKREILSIKYSNGEIERFNSTNTNTNSPTNSGNNNRQTYDNPTDQRSSGPRTDPFAIIAIAAGGLAILTGYGAFLLGAGAIIFGALSLSRINKEPNRFKGKGLALAGMIAGIVAAALIALYIFL